MTKSRVVYGGVIGAIVVIFIVVTTVVFWPKAHRTDPEAGAHIGPESAWITFGKRSEKSWSLVEMVVQKAEDDYKFSFSHDISFINITALGNHKVGTKVKIEGMTGGIGDRNVTFTFPQSLGNYTDGQLYRLAIYTDAAKPVRTENSEYPDNYILLKEAPNWRTYDHSSFQGIVYRVAKNVSALVNYRYSEVFGLSHNSGKIGRIAVLRRMDTPFGKSFQVTSKIIEGGDGHPNVKIEFHLESGPGFACDVLLYKDLSTSSFSTEEPKDLTKELNRSKSISARSWSSASISISTSTFRPTSTPTPRPPSTLAADSTNFPDFNHLSRNLWEHPSSRVGVKKPYQFADTHTFGKLIDGGRKLVMEQPLDLKVGTENGVNISNLK